MYDLIKFFKPAYLLELQPYTSLGTIKIMMIFFAVVTAIGIGLKIYERTAEMEKFRSKLLDKLVSLFITLGLLGIGLTWVRYERVQILSARFWLLVWLAALFAWLYPILKYLFKVVPEAKKHAEESRLMRKYLPAKK